MWVVIQVHDIMQFHPESEMGSFCKQPAHSRNYSLYNFEIRRDVTSGRLRISGEVPWNARVVYGIAAKYARFMAIRSEVRNRPEVTSRLILNLCKLYNVNV